MTCLLKMFHQVTICQVRVNRRVVYFLNRSNESVQRDTDSTGGQLNDYLQRIKINQSNLGFIIPLS